MSAQTRACASGRILRFPTVLDTPPACGTCMRGCDVYLLNSGSHLVQLLHHRRAREGDFSSSKWIFSVPEVDIAYLEVTEK
jgi:hypothetical protein